MSNYRNMIEIPASVHESIWQMFRYGPIWDGNLVCKTSARWLQQQGYAARTSGFNFLTSAGVDLAVSLGMDRRKETEAKK